jgi:2'-5' RNA ligase
MRVLLISVVGEAGFCGISKLRERLCGISHSYASLQFPPHITLAHIRIPENEKISLYGFLEDRANEQSPFQIKTNGIVPHTYKENGKQKYTVRFDIEENPLLAGFRAALLSAPVGNKKEFAEPHITLAFGDLTENNFLMLQSYLAANKENLTDFEYAFDNLSLLTRGEDRWRIDARFPVS